MKRVANLFAVTLVLLCATGTALGGGCELNLVGTWQATAASGEVVLYQFAPDGTVRVFSEAGSVSNSQRRELGQATYKFDQSTKTKAIEFSAANGKFFAAGRTVMEISEFDDQSLTCQIKNSAPTRWTRVDPNRYFIVLAARQQVFYNNGGPAFPILIKTAGTEPEFVAVGTYAQQGHAAFGAVPAATYREFLREARKDSEVVLRLEINSAQYERSLKILRTWERRAREDALLYPFGDPLNNVLLVKAVTETLNQCSEKIKLYNLNYVHPEDWISNQHSPGAIPFVYFKELRRLNETLHLPDDKFQSLWSGTISKKN